MEETKRLVQRFEMFLDPEDAVPLKGRCFYELLWAMIGNEAHAAYERLDEEFAQRVETLHTVDLRTLTREQQQAAVRVARQRDAAFRLHGQRVTMPGRNRHPSLRIHAQC